MSGLKDKVVVITGASAGIGAATAVEFAKYGVRMMLTGRDKNRLDGVIKQCLDQGATQLEGVICDLTTDEGVKALVTATKDKFGTVHVLVNNAGGSAPTNRLYPDLRSSKGNTADFDYAYSLMVRAAWQLSGLFVEDLIKNKGAIINNTSVLGVISDPLSSAYGAMKAALNYMTRCMALELGKEGVRVNAVMPGYTLTNIGAGMGMSHEEFVEMFKEKARRAHPLQGQVLEASDVAKAIVFLASDDASKITGVLLPVDGGALLCSPMYDFSSKTSS